MRRPWPLAAFFMRILPKRQPQDAPGIARRGLADPGYPLSPRPEQQINRRDFPHNSRVVFVIANYLKDNESVLTELVKRPAGRTVNINYRA